MRILCIRKIKILFDLLLRSYNLFPMFYIYLFIQLQFERMLNKIRNNFLIDLFRSIVLVLDK